MCICQESKNRCRGPFLRFPPPPSTISLGVPAVRSQLFLLAGSDAGTGIRSVKKVILHANEDDIYRMCVECVVLLTTSALVLNVVVTFLHFLFRYRRRKRQGGQEWCPTSEGCNETTHSSTRGYTSCPR